MIRKNNEQSSTTSDKITNDSPSNKRLIGCSKASQIMLVTFNVLSGILALMLIGTCIWIRSDKYVDLSMNAVKDVDSGTIASIRMTASAWIFIGVFVFALSFLGCFGAWKKDKVFLGLYTGCIIVLFILQLIAIFLLMSYKGVFSVQLKSSMDNMFHEHVLKPMNGSSTHHNSTRKRPTGIMIFGTIEQALKCCGLHGPHDYQHVPLTCSSKSGDKYNVGCLAKIDEHLNKHMPAIISLQVSFICIEFFSILLAVAVGLGIPERYD
ncbi:hypothetical protein ACOME3_002478 [Neoechinorhynchus agilis]